MEASLAGNGVSTPSIQQNTALGAAVSVSVCRSHQCHAWSRNQVFGFGSRTANPRSGNKSTRQVSAAQRWPARRSIAIWLKVLKINTNDRTNVESKSVLWTARLTNSANLPRLCRAPAPRVRKTPRPANQHVRPVALPPFARRRCSESRGPRVETSPPRRSIRRQSIG